MPISPEAKKRYPPEWPQVRLQILVRAAALLLAEIERLDRAAG
jgi:hypothetical protein